MKSRNRKFARQVKRTAKVAAATCVLAGCSSTYVITERANECNLNKGVPYYLPKRLAKVTVTKIEDGRFDAHLNDLPPIADPCQAYVAIPVKHWYRSDVIDIRTSPDGLLSSAYITGEQRNAGIQDNIRLSSIFFNKEGQKDELNRALHFTEDSKTAALAGREPGIIVFEAAFDPGSPPDIDKVNASLKKYKMVLEVPVSAHCGPVQPQVDRITGLVFRPAVQRPCYVKSSKDDAKVIASINGVTPDQAPLFNLPLKGGFLAHHSHNLELREGSVTGYYSRRPSEIAGLFKQSQEIVEDAGSVVAAVIAPLAAAIDVKRTAENQSDSGTSAEAVVAPVAVADQKAIDDQAKKTAEQLEAQNVKIQEIIDQLQAQQNINAEQANAAGTQDLLDVLPTRKSKVASAPSAENETKSSKKSVAKVESESKDSSKSESVESSDASSADATYASAAPAVPAFDPIAAGMPNVREVSSRPSLFSRMRNLVPIGQKTDAPAVEPVANASDSRIKQGAGRFFNRVKDVAPFRDTNPAASEPSEFASGKSTGYTSPSGGVNLSQEAAIQFANAAQANSAVTQPVSSEGMQAGANVPASRPSFLNRIKNVLPHHNTQAAMEPVTSPQAAPSLSATPSELAPDLAAMPHRASGSGRVSRPDTSTEVPGTGAVTGTEPNAIAPSAPLPELSQTMQTTGQRPSMLSRLKSALPHRNVEASANDLPYVAPAPVEAPPSSASSGNAGNVLAMHNASI